MITHLLRRTLFTTLSIVAFLFLAKAQPANWQPRGIGGGGSLFFPGINPANDNEFYITCDMSQLFHSTDFGRSYQQVSFTQLQTGNRSVYQFTSDNKVAYCIANDGNINYAVRTMDGGKTWAALPGNPMEEDVYKLIADYDNPGRVIVGYYGSVYISNNHGVDFAVVKNASDNGVGIVIAGVYFDAGNIYIATNEGILFSDDGEQFSMLSTTGIPEGQVIFSFAGAQQVGIIRFFCITVKGANIWKGIQPWEYYGMIKGVYSMDIGTNNWLPKMSGIDINTDFMMYVGMARNNINTVYLGGSDGSTGGASVIKSTDAGNSWLKVFLTGNNENIRTGWSGQGGDRGWGYGEACFGISVAPNNADKVVFGDFGFVHTSSDGGTTWQQAYVSAASEHPAGAPTPPRQYYQSIGLENTSVWQVHWQDANNMFACFSDIRGLRSTDGGMSWGFDYTGHTANSMYHLVKHNTSNTMFAATSGVHDMYQSTRLADNLLDAADPSGSIIYSTDNGANWQLLHQFNHPVFWLATDPNQPNRLYASVIHYGNGAGDGGIWYTNDLDNLAGSTWTKLPNTLRTEGHPATIVVLNDGKVVCTYSGRRTACGFTPSSGVFIFDPATNGWSDVSDDVMLYWTKDIVLDPADASQNTWYGAVFSGWGGAPNGKGGLYRTTNRGTSWTKLTGTQFDRITSISFNPSVNNEAYLTTETQGLWRSTDIRSEFPAWSLVNDYPFRQPERVFFNPYNPDEIWVTSFGSGLRVGLQSSALPIYLLSFSGNRSGENITLYWSAADAETGYAFSVEKSVDGNQFFSIGQMAAGQTGMYQYQWKDTSNHDVVYYRIRVHTSISQTQYSPTIKLTRNETGNNRFRLMQNLVQHVIVLEAITDKAGLLHAQLIDVNGRLVLKQIIRAEKGINHISLQLPHHTVRGMHYLKVKTASKDLTLPVLVH